MTTARLDHARRWGIEFKAPGSKVWREIGTAGTEDLARKWLLLFSASGGFRVRRPVR